MSVFFRLSLWVNRKSGGPSTASAAPGPLFLLPRQLEGDLMGLSPGGPKGPVDATQAVRSWDPAGPATVEQLWRHCTKGWGAH